MFKKLVPVVTLLMFAAGPVFAADTAAPSSDTSASAPAKTHKASPQPQEEEQGRCRRLFRAEEVSPRLNSLPWSPASTAGLFVFGPPVGIG